MDACVYLMFPIIPHNVHVLIFINCEFSKARVKTYNTSSCYIPSASRKPWTVILCCSRTLRLY